MNSASSAWDFPIHSGQYRVRVVPEGRGYRAKLISVGIGTTMEPHGNSPTEALMALVRELYDTESVYERKLAKDIVRHTALPIVLGSPARSKSHRSPTTKAPSKRGPEAANVRVYSRPSGYWYAQAHDATTGTQITDASGYSREDALRTLRGKFAMIGVQIRSITDEDPYADPRTKQSRHATKKSAVPGELSAMLSDPQARKMFAREMRHEMQKRQTSRVTEEARAARPFTVKRWEQVGDRRFRDLVGNYATAAEARARADQLGGWVETRDGRVLYGRAEEP